MMYVVLGLIVLVLLYFVFIYNKFQKQEVRVNEAFSTMDIYLKKRWDLIPNLVEVVKGYAKHEKSTLEDVIGLRSKSYDSLSQEEKIDVNNKLSDSIVKVMAIVENYPDLKASENFLSLQKDIVTIEDEIAKSRKYFNAVVRDYNNLVVTIPSNLVALIFGFKEKLMFAAKDEEKNNVKVDI